MRHFLKFLYALEFPDCELKRRVINTETYFYKPAQGKADRLLNFKHQIRNFHEYMRQNIVCRLHLYCTMISCVILELVPINKIELRCRITKVRLVNGEGRIMKWRKLHNESLTLQLLLG